MQLLRFNTWMKKSLNEQRKSQKNDFSNWEGFREDVSPSQKKVLMKDLIKKLQNKDWWYFMSDDRRSYDRGKKEDEVIHDLMMKIGGEEPKKLYKKYGKKSGVLEGKNVFEWLQLVEDEYKNKKDGEKDKRTKKEKEEDDELVDVKPKIKKNESVDKSGSLTLEQLVAQRYGQSTVFPETRGITHTGSLNEIRPVGAKGTSYFCDAGNIYENATQWKKPTPKLKSMEEKCLERNSVYGKLYKGE